MECAKAEANYDFRSPALWTFDAPEPETLARGMYSYTDNSTSIATFRIPSNQRPGELDPKTWEPPTAVMPRCSDPPNDRNHAIHIQGGPFLSWGGGVGIGMKNFPAVTGTVPPTRSILRCWT